MSVFTRNGAHDLAGTVGLGPVPIETDEPVFQATWQARTHGATIAAIITGILVPPTHRAVIEALHPVAYLSMTYDEKWLYALERCAVTAGVLTQEEIEARVTDTLATPDAPMPPDRNPEILAGVLRFINEGVPHGPEHLAQPPRFAPGDVVRTKHIVLESPGRPHTRLPGYAQDRLGIVEIVHRPMLLEEVLVASGEVRWEYVYAVRLRTRDIWPDAAERDTIMIDLWESYLFDHSLPADQDQEQP